MLLLRAGVGVTAVLHGIVCLADTGHLAFGISLAGIVAVASGAALLVGFLTPLAGALVGLGAIGTMFSWLPPPPANQFETPPMTTLVMVVAVAIVLLGPGALSIDARLFGRREIIIPRTPRPPLP